MDALDHLNEVLPKISERKFILFIGAGISKISGCADWDGMVNSMAADLGETISFERISHNEWLQHFKLAYEKNGNGNKFWQIVREGIIPNPKQLSESYIPLAKILQQIRPQPPILTTNIDNCLEMTRLFSADVYRRLSEFTQANLNTGGIFHIHGSIEDLENALITTSQYQQHYETPEMRTFLDAVFNNEHSVLFLGYGLKDAELKMKIRNNRRQGAHYALVPAEDNFRPEEIATFKDVHGVNIIVYGNRSSLKQSLEGWISKVFAVSTLEENEKNMCGEQ